MRRIDVLGAVLAALTAAALAGCGSANPAPASSTTVSASPSPAATPTPGTRLTFTGTVTGAVSGAAPSGTCGKGATGASGADLRFQLGGRAYSLSIEVLSYHGPGAYPLPPDRASLHTTTIGPGSQFFGSQKGTVTVAANESSGTIDADLAGDSGAVHVTGAWSCAG